MSQFKQKLKPREMNEEEKIHYVRLLRELETAIKTGKLTVREMNIISSRLHQTRKWIEEGYTARFPESIGGYLYQIIRS